MTSLGYRDQNDQSSRLRDLLMGSLAVDTFHTLDDRAICTSSYDTSLRPSRLHKIIEENSWRTLVLVYPISSVERPASYVDITPICAPSLKRNPWTERQESQADVDADATTSYSAISRHNPAAECFHLPTTATKVDASHAGQLIRSSPNLSKVPIEIWNIVIDNLSREDLKNLRLTSKVVEQSVSARLFKTVVVPFNIDLLIDPNSRDRQLLTRPYSPSSDEKSVNIFSNFSPHIQNFGMAFEVREDSLINPPTKTMMETHKTYWGSYEWPKPQYPRFKDTADLELAADDTSAMKRAFAHLTEVTHLALSVDSGLGWITGPDKTLKSQVLPNAYRVFGQSFRSNRENVARQELWSLIQQIHMDFGEPNLPKDLELARTEELESKLLAEMIVARPTIRLSREFFLKNLLHKATSADKTVEHTATDEIGHFSGKEDFGYESVDGDSQINRRNGGNRIERTDRRNLPPHATRLDNKSLCKISDKIGFKNVEETPSHLERGRTQRADRLEHLDHEKDTQNGNSSPNDSQQRFGLLFSRPNGAKAANARPLVPRQLNQAQKEWLLENAWAHDAFLSSYLVSVSDNASTFMNVTRLTISRLSSRHLPELQRKDFWQSLTSLSSLSILVIADLRDVQKSNVGIVETMPLSPSEAAAAFYYLLKGPLSMKSSIKTLQVGWVNGGEHAQGLFARNNHILPAPIVPSGLMIEEREKFEPCLISFPHVQRLTLSNCWISPGVTEAVLELSNMPNLKALTLDSVSLTAHIPIEVQQVQNNAWGVPGPPLHNWPPNPWNLVQYQILGQRYRLSQRLSNILLTFSTDHAKRVFNETMQAFGGSLLEHNNPLWMAGPVIVPPINGQYQTHYVPGQGSWVEILEQAKRNCAAMEKCRLALTCNSCGYARLTHSRAPQTGIVEAEIEFSLFDAPLSAKRESHFHSRREELSEMMMKDKDPLHAQIAFALTRSEMCILHDRWGFQSGWPAEEAGMQQRHEDEISRWGAQSKEAVEYDGARPAGTSRFSGSIDNLLASRH